MSTQVNSIPSLCDWQTSTEYQQNGVDLAPTKFLEVTDLLLENPNFNSSHLFRADILFDTSGLLTTTEVKEKICCGSNAKPDQGHSIQNDATCLAKSQPTIDDKFPDRVVVRRLIPRKPALDRPLEQTCLIYHLNEYTYAVVYIPEVEDESEIPWYHPPVKALAYLYDRRSVSDHDLASLSIHFLPFNNTPGPLPDRLHRTFISLLTTFLRLSKHPSNNTRSPTTHSTAPSANKDTIIPQHLVQNTYTRLKQIYASSLIAQWVEPTEPSKHVFEDLSIAAFLIELWKLIYTTSSPFPGFIDIACGNGVLVYILLQEGYNGSGFDARRRKTWNILDIDEHLEERICVPQPFLDVLNLNTQGGALDFKVHNGVFRRDMFIISNHADELTPWTPLLAALSNPISPLPFLAIPCCSHALSGVKHRYTLKDIHLADPSDTAPNVTRDGGNGEVQASSGDLKSLRVAKKKEASHADDKSMYACLTKKVVALAEEVGCDRGDVEMTLMRIPSTRNIGVVGGRHRNGVGRGMDALTLGDEFEGGDRGGEVALREKIQAIIERECAVSGGVEAAARMWVERARQLQTGKGRGKVNLGYKPESKGTSQACG